MLLLPSPAFAQSFWVAGRTLSESRVSVGNLVTEPFQCALTQGDVLAARAEDAARGGALNAVEFLADA